MTAIVYDYATIAAALRGDDWWEPAKIEPLPINLPSISLIEELLRCTKLVEEITGINHLPEPITRPPDGKWRLLQQGKPIT